MADPRCDDIDAAAESILDVLAHASEPIPYHWIIGSLALTPRAEVAAWRRLTLSRTVVPTCGPGLAVNHTHLGVCRYRLALDDKQQKLL